MLRVLSSCNPEVEITEIEISYLELSSLENCCNNLREWFVTVDDVKVNRFFEIYHVSLVTSVEETRRRSIEIKVIEICRDLPHCINFFSNS